MEIEGIKISWNQNDHPSSLDHQWAHSVSEQSLGPTCTEQTGWCGAPDSRSHRPSIRKQCNEVKGSSQWITGCKQGVCRFLRKEQYKRVIIQSGSKGNSSFTTTIDIFPRKYIYLLQAQIIRLELIFLNMGAVTKLLLLSENPSQVLGKH